MQIAFDSPPTEAIAYLKDKRPEFHWDYDELMHASHHKAFTVAKVTRLDLLTDIQESLVRAQSAGMSFESWKKALTPTLKEKGWWEQTEVMNPQTGEFKTIFVGSKRLRTIYETNMRTSYAQGKWRSLADSDMAYLRYSAILDIRTRDDHRIAHGTILPIDDPFWETHYPPNGWGCRCKVSGYTKSQFDARGMKQSPRPDPFAHPDWSYHVGKNKYFDDKYTHPCAGTNTNTKKECTNTENYQTKGLPKLQELPKELIKASPNLLQKGVNRDDGYAIIKKAVLGESKQRVIKTPLEDVIITAELLRHAVAKEPREIYAHFMIQTLSDPLEVWFTRFNDGKIRPQYIALFDHPKAILVSVVLGRDGSLIWNFMGSDIPKMNKKRVGEWMWKKY